MNEHLLDYLLDELTPAERAAFEADPASMAEALRLRPVVARLESLEREEWNPPAPPPLFLPRLPAPERAPRPAPRRRWLPALRPLVAAGLALLLLAIGAGAGRLLDQRGPGEGGRRLALDPVEPAGHDAHGTATILAHGHRARFAVRGLKPNTGGDFYELWLMNSDDDLVSLGSFRVSGSGAADVTVPLPADPAGFAALDISAEPADGNPAHSAQSVLRTPLKPS
jgi:hypothetical protein